MLIDAAKLKTKIAEFSDERMLGELERLTYYLHDGHSYILPVSPKYPSVFLPIQFYIFSDGIFIIDADEPYNELIGCKVLSIYDIPTAKLVGDMNSYIHQDNKFTVKWFAPSFLRFRSVYEPYGLRADSTNISLKLKDKTNKVIERKINFVPVTSFHGIPKLFPSKLADDKSIPLYLSNVEDNYWFTPLPQNHAIYFQFNQVEDKENESLDAFSKKLDTALQSANPTLLIVDVRHNNGGNLTLLPPLMDVLENFERRNQKAQIVIITGRNTFSAAQIFISLMNKNTHAIFAGEPSASSPNFVGEGNYITLPFSKALGSISNKYHETIPGDKRKWIEPNWPVSLSSTTYFENRDPVLALILSRSK